MPPGSRSTDNPEAAKIAFAIVMGRVGRPRSIYRYPTWTARLKGSLEFPRPFFWPAFYNDLLVGIELYGVPALTV